MAALQTNLISRAGISTANKSLSPSPRGYRGPRLWPRRGTAISRRTAVVCRAGTIAHRRTAIVSHAGTITHRRTVVVRHAGTTVATARTAVVRRFAVRPHYEYKRCLRSRRITGGRKTFETTYTHRWPENACEVTYLYRVPDSRCFAVHQYWSSCVRHLSCAD